MNGMPMNQTPMQPTVINVVLVPDQITMDNYPIQPGGSVMFLDDKMTKFTMRSKNQTGFPNPDRVWSMKEVTPPPQTPGNYATKDDLADMNNAILEMKKMLEDLTK